MDVGLCDNLIDSAIWKYQFKKITGCSTCRQCDSWPTCLVKLWQLCTGCWATCNFHIWIRLFAIGTDLIFGIDMKPRKRLPKLAACTWHLLQALPRYQKYAMFTELNPVLIGVLPIRIWIWITVHAAVGSHLFLQRMNMYCSFLGLSMLNGGGTYVPTWWACSHNLGKYNRACASSISN